MRLVLLFLVFKHVCCWGQCTELRLAGHSRSQHWLARFHTMRWWRRNPTQGDIFLPRTPGLAGILAAKNPSPAWQGHSGQLSRSRINSFLPATTGGCSAKASRITTPTSLFILDSSDQGSEFVFVSFPHNNEKSQHRDKPCQNGRVFSKPLARTSPE